ncbi:hypothetical protein FRC19_000437 [Serendipita sp. 401]|nr:hypothetical protein FRC19_000437 [Serendipita sp. 401]
MRSFLQWTAVALSIPSLVHGFHNVSYNSNDPALAYSPVGAWKDWPAAGCLSWPVGQWSSVPGSITLRFSGVAIYAYGLFDDASIPILEVQIDDEPATPLSTYAPADTARCDPIFSKTGLAYGNHTIVLKLTNQRPDDVKDLSFQGFMVTVPDPGDDVSGGGSGKPRKSRTGLIAAVIAVVAVVLILALVAFFFWRRRKGRSNKPAPVPTNYGPTDPMMSSQKVDTPDHSVPPPVPFFLPPSNQQSVQQQNLGQAPWAQGAPDNNSPYGNTPYNGQPQQTGYYQNGSAYGLSATGGYVPSATPPVHPNSPSYYGASTYSDPNAPHQPSHYGSSAYPDPNAQHQQAHLSYQPPPSDYSSTAFTQTTSSGYGASSEKAQIAADYSAPSNYYTPPPIAPPPADQNVQPMNVSYRKGQVNQHAAPVTRTDGQGTSGGDAAPPEYGS